MTGKLTALLRGAGSKAVAADDPVAAMHNMTLWVRGRPHQALGTDLAAPIRRQCGVCDDDGLISNWAGSSFDLRRRQLTLVGPVSEILIPHDVAAALRELQLMDADCERLVFATRARDDRAILSATGSDLDELIGFVAAEANHETSRRRRQRLDTAFDTLSNVHAAGS